MVATKEMSAKLEIPFAVIDAALDERVKQYAAAVANMMRFDFGDVIDIEDAAKLLGVSSRLLYSMVARKEVPAHRIASKLKFYKPELKQWLLSHDQKGKDDD